MLAEAHHRQQHSLSRAAAIITDGGQPIPSFMPSSEEVFNRLAQLTKTEENKQKTIDHLTEAITQLRKEEAEIKASIKRLYIDERELQAKLHHLVERVAENQQRLDQSCIDRQETLWQLGSEQGLFDID
jgi:chromosome segregation ATPase